MTNLNLNINNIIHNIQVIAETSPPDRHNPNCGQVKPWYPFPKNTRTLNYGITTINTFSGMAKNHFRDTCLIYIMKNM